MVHHTPSLFTKRLFLLTWVEAFSLRESRTVSRDVSHICEHPNKRSWHIWSARLFLSNSAVVANVVCKLQMSIRLLSTTRMPSFLLVLTQTLFLLLPQKDLLWKFWCHWWRACYSAHFPLCCLVRASKNHNACSSSPQFFWNGPIIFFLFFSVIPAMYPLSIMKEREKNWSRYGRLVRSLFQ